MGITERGINLLVLPSLQCIISNRIDYDEVFKSDLFVHLIDIGAMDG